LGTKKDSLNADLHVTRNTPPTFLLHAENDNVDGPSNSLSYYSALKDAGVPTELHMYAEGRHAFGLREEILMHELLHRAIRLANRVAVIARARKIGIRESDATVRTMPQDVPRRRLAVDAEKEAWLRIHVRVAPAIENDSRDIPAWIEPARREHVRHLLPERALVLRERSAEQRGAPTSSLLGDREPRLCE